MKISIKGSVINQREGLPGGLQENYGNELIDTFIKRDDEEEAQFIGASHVPSDRDKYKIF